MKKNNIIIIPAFEPTPILLEIVTQLSACAEQKIIIVDDGSSLKTTSLFELLRKNYQVIILKHRENSGKGKALKTAFEYVLTHFKPEECLGVITADADGQHLVPDILKVSERQFLKPHSLILGVRDFKGEIPLSSSFGNFLTRFLFRIIFKKKLQDTQTGLRAIPYFFIKDLLSISTNAYDFELEMLVKAMQNKQTIEEVSVQTIYHEGNANSHFHPLWDSFKVYFVFCRFWFGR